MNTNRAALILPRLLIMLLSFRAASCLAEAKSPFHSPFELAFSPDGKTLAVSDHTADSLFILKLDTRSVAQEVGLRGPATGVAWTPDSAHIWVAEYATDSVAQVVVDTGQVAQRLPVGSRPMGLAMAPKQQLLVVANSASDDLSVIDLKTGVERARVRVPRMPYFLAISPDETKVVAGNFLPEGSAASPEIASAISIIDLTTRQVRATIRLPAGSTLVRQVAISPDGQWAYAAHIVGRFNVPLTQLERGWMIGNAISIIDLAKNQLYATVLLDQFNQGATDPWGLRLAPRGDWLWTTLSGVHRLARVNLVELRLLLAGSPQASLPARQDSVAIWEEIRRDPDLRKSLVNDLDALSKAGLLANYALPGKGPRGLDISPDGKLLAVAAYYAGKVFLIETANGRINATIALGEEPELDQARRGEIIFHDATYSFQQWLSCGTCHPEGRTDGLNWDLVNDGIGNPKNTRSLLLAHQTPPVMSLGIRANMEVAVSSGYRSSLFSQLKEEEINAVRAYIRSLQPEPSPHRLRQGELSDRAMKGKSIFESSQTGCAACHPAPLFTDLRLHDVGTHRPPEPAAEFDTPTLIEIWRTAPYLHHGAATNLLEVFTAFNPKQQHGTTAHLTADELAALVEYVLSL